MTRVRLSLLNVYFVWFKKNWFPSSPFLPNHHAILEELKLGRFELMAFVMGYFPRRCIYNLKP